MKKNFVSNQHHCKYLFFKFVCLFVFSESVVKVLLSTMLLDEAQLEAVKKILNQVVQNHLKFHDFSGGNRAVALRSLTGHLTGTYDVLSVRYGKDSIIICNIVIILIIYKITTNNRLLVEVQPK